jgi:hypothetical protein
VFRSGSRRREHLDDVTDGLSAERARRSSMRGDPLVRWREGARQPPTGGRYSHHGESIHVD